MTKSISPLQERINNIEEMNARMEASAKKEGRPFYNRSRDRDGCMQDTLVDEERGNEEFDRIFKIKRMECWIAVHAAHAQSTSDATYMANRAVDAFDKRFNPNI